MLLGTTTTVCQASCSAAMTCKRVRLSLRPSTNNIVGRSHTSTLSGHSRRIYRIQHHSSCNSTAAQLCPGLLCVCVYHLRRTNVQSSTSPKAGNECRCRNKWLALKLLRAAVMLLYPLPYVLPVASAAQRLILLLCIAPSWLRCCIGYRVPRPTEMVTHSRLVYWEQQRMYVCTRRLQFALIIYTAVHLYSSVGLLSCSRR